MPEPCVVLLDVDGTLVDSNYLHTIAWHRALRRSGHTVPMTAVHRLIGMGADQLLSRLLGQEDDPEHVEARWAEEFERLRPEVTATSGARDLVRALHERGASTVYATSGQPQDVDALRAVIGADEWVDEVVDSSEVEASKPAPDIFRLGLDRAGVGTDRAVVVGDTVWDVEAATACGVPCVAVTTGGISRPELEAAGAAAVYESPDELLRHLDVSPLGVLLGGGAAGP